MQPARSSPRPSCWADEFKRARIVIKSRSEGQRHPSYFRSSRIQRSPGTARERQESRSALASARKPTQAGFTGSNSACDPKFADRDTAGSQQQLAPAGGYHESTHIPPVCARGATFCCLIDLTGSARVDAWTGPGSSGAEPGTAPEAIQWLASSTARMPWVGASAADVESD
jgi:hypothetical protein